MNDGTTKLQAVTLAVSNQGLNRLLRTITPDLISQSFTAPSMSALSHPVTVPSTNNHIDVNTIYLSGGTISDISVTSTPSVSYGGDGNPCVSLGGGFHISYAAWNETGSTFPEGNTSPSPYGNDFGAFHFDITNIDLSFEVQPATGTPGAALQWGNMVQVTNPKQKNVSVANVAIPSGSYLHGSDLSCVNGKVQDKVDAMVADVNYASKLAGALNGVLTTIPSSGQLSSAILYEFEPSCAPTFPNQEGLQIGIAGGVSYDGTGYSASPVSIPLPKIQTDRDVVINVAAYEANALLWAAFQAGELGVDLTQASAENAATLNSGYFQQIWPSLYAFGQAKNANGVPLQVVAMAAEAPVVAIRGVLQLTGTIYTGLQSTLDATTYAKVEYMVGIIYYSVAAFNAALAEYLTPAEVTKYGTTILDAVQAGAADPVMSVPLSINVAFNYMDQGTWTPLLSFTINRSNVLSALSLNENKLTFTFSQQNIDTVTDVQVVESALDGVVAVVLDFVWVLFAPSLNVALESVGTRGIPLPTIGGITLGSPSISLVADDGGYVSLSTNIRRA